MELVQCFLLTFFVLATVAYPTNIEDDKLKEVDPEEAGDYFDGDMILDEEQKAEIFSRGRNIKKGDKYKWKNAEVFYKIDEIFNSQQVEQILKAINEIEKVTCIRFFPKAEWNKDYINIIGSGKGCNAAVGYGSGARKLNLAPSNPGHGCFKLFKIVHEFLHSLGFHHQQSNYNRDDYVEIRVDNIKEGHEHNFKKYDSSVVTDLGIEYDYDSVMHYGEKHFSKNGKLTIVPLTPDVQIGQRLRLSKKDIVKLNTLYASHVC